MESQSIVKYPLMTERSVSLIENENKLVFIVDRRATKPQIAQAMEELYEIEVESINTLITRKGDKKAFVKLKEGFDASDVAIRLGVL